MKTKTPANPADRVLRVRLREPLRFPDLSERLAIKVSGIPNYTARAHFGMWHRKLGAPNFNTFTGVFTPLYYVEIEATDVPIDPLQPIWVRGQTGLARVVDAQGNIEHLIRDGHHVVLAGDGKTEIGRAHLLNVLTRYDTDPAKRKVTSLPPEWGVGEAPSRIETMPKLEDLLPSDRLPDATEQGERRWHYGQTDPNRHVSGMEYVRVMESFAAELAADRGITVKDYFFAGVKILYRKPCFSGEGYRRVAWLKQNDPLIIAGAIYKTADGPNARPATAIEFRLKPFAQPTP